MRVGRIKGVGYTYKPVRLGVEKYRIAFGAFKKSIEKGMVVPVYERHDPRMVMGVTTSLEETDKGLAFMGVLFLDSHKALDLYRRIEAGTMMASPLGVSIGVALGDGHEDTSGKVYRSAMLTEVSITSTPADEMSYVLSMGEEEMSWDSVEKLLDQAIIRVKLLDGIRRVWLPPETTGSPCGSLVEV